MGKPLFGSRRGASGRRRRGAALMEYVIVAVLIAAAAVAAVAVFGRSIVAMLNVGGHAAVGDAKKAGDALDRKSVV